jgi:hypothetical protein
MTNRRIQQSEQYSNGRTACIINTELIMLYSEADYLDLICVHPTNLNGKLNHNTQ